MKNDEHNNGQLISMSNKNPQFGAFIAQSLTNSLYENPKYAQKLGLSLPNKNETLGGEVIKFLDNQLVRRGVSYDPVVYFVKDSVADIQQRPIVAIGRRINGTNEVPAWEGDNEIQLTESNVLNHEGLIIFVGIGNEGGKATVITPNTSGETMTGDLRDNTVQLRSTVTVVITQFQLKNAFETSNTSELKGFVMRYPNSNNPGSLWQAGFSSINVSVNDIGKIFNPNPAKPFFAFSDTDWNNNDFFFALYEYDWYASIKEINNDCTNSLNTSVDVRMVFSDEWYYKWCTTNKGSSFLGSSGATVTGENDKSKFILKRL